MLSKNFSAILVVDFQAGFVASLKDVSPSLPKEFVKKMVSLLQAADMSNTQIFYSKLKNPLPSFKEKLSFEFSNEDEGMVLEANDNSAVYAKNNYGLPENLLAKLKEKVDLLGKPILVTGLETDACVLSACFDLWNADIDFRVSTNHIASANPKAHEYAQAIISRQFGALVQDAMSFAQSPTFTVNEKLI
jgi:nicotinamidase-related amidase